jgi:hypothetical protein
MSHVVAPWRSGRTSEPPVAGSGLADLDGASSDFFVARDRDVEVKPAATLRIQGAHPLRLALLESLLTERGIVPAVMWAARPDIDGGPRGPWITRLSDELTGALARLSGLDHVHEVAVRWRNADPEWEVAERLPDELTVGLLLLAHLSRDALRRDGRVWCWTELPTAPPRDAGWRRRLPRQVVRKLASDRAR